MKKIISSLLVLVMAFTMVACSRSTTTTDTSKDSSTTTDAIQAVGKDINNDSLKVALCVASMDANPVNWDEGIKKALGGYTNVEYQVFNANGNAETQSQQFTEIINSGFNAIIVNAVDAAALASASEKAEAAGIKVVDINNGPQSIHTASIVNNAYNTGVLCANNAAEKINGVEANCVAIGAPVALATVVKGAQGFEDTLKSFPNLKFLENQPGDFTTEKGNAIMRDLLTKYKNDIDVVFCQNDAMAIGAAQAIDAAGLTGKILVYGCDGLDVALEYIKDGKMTGTVYVNNVECGALAASIALYSLASGGDTSKLSATPTINLPAVVVDATNLSQYSK